MIDQAVYNNNFKTDEKRIFFREKAMNKIKSFLPSDMWPIALDVLDRMPIRPRASQDLRSLNIFHSTSPMLLDRAIDCPWMAFDSNAFRNTLIIDIDHADWFEPWFELDPSIRPHMVVDPWSGRAHAILFLSSPVLTTDRAGYKPQKFADYAGRLLAAYFKGTLLPQGSVVKNPFGLERNMIGTRKKLGTSAQYPQDWEYIQCNGMMWRTISGVSSAELSSIFKLLSQNYNEECSLVKSRFNRYGRNYQKPDDLGRNDSLFDQTRHFAYRTYEKNLHTIIAAATRINNDFPHPLPISEVKSVSKSIAGFMERKYKGGSNADPKVERGRDISLVYNLNTKQSQTVAAKQTNLFQKKGTDEKIEAGLKALSNSGVKITQKSLAMASKLSERTIRSRWHSLPIKEQRLKIAKKTMVLNQGENRQNAGLSGNTCSDAESNLSFSLISLDMNSNSLSSLATISREHNKIIRSDKHLIQYYNLIHEKMNGRASKFIQKPVKAPVYSTESYKSYQQALESYQVAVLRKHRRDKKDRLKRRYAEIKRISRMKYACRQKAWCKFIELLEYEWQAKIEFSSANSRAGLMQFKKWAINRVQRTFLECTRENNMNGL